ncbi:MAG: 16S rRNA (cytidine(1402)-2'-O)-methyltransferase, partial [Lachnospiraceae bacterium]|nr:16S rRNA (cytidine(1402)-2'-O)-methyltransferase [Lachnospiraceae bacterium]
GTNIALVTDAGTPGISDPGEEIVKQAHAAGVPVTSLPGACACITALTVSGLSTRRFAFEAFLPSDKKERQRILTSLQTETRTVILYESPHHLKNTLSLLHDFLGNRPITLCRELTKIHESIQLMTLADAISYYQEHDPRGEYVLVLAGRDPAELEAEEKSSWQSISIEEHMERYLSQGLSRKDAMKQVALDRGVPKREIYQSLLS